MELPQPGQSSLSQERRWTLSGDCLVVPVAVHPPLQDLLGSFLLHRYRQLQARGDQFLLPIDLLISEDRLTLRFRDAGALAEAAGGGSAPTGDLLSFKLHELLPVLSTLCECQAQGVSGFAPFLPVRGRLVPPVSFFFPGPGGDLRRDLDPIEAWLERHVRAHGGPQGDSFFDQLRAALRQADPAVALEHLVAAEQERTRHLTARPSFLELLTEAELLEHVARVLRYRVRRDLSPPGSRDLWLEVTPRWLDRHFQDLARPTVQELWELLTEDSRVTPELTASAGLPDPLRPPPKETAVVHWLMVDATEPLLCVKYPRADSPRVPSEGYLCATQAGDFAVIGRKRRFAPFAGAHQALAPFLHAPRAAARPLTRDTLDEAIISARGPFAVQGPPGTGKTYLATQVVTRFLQAHPGARILICAKEHFALNHILATITAKLREDGQPFRAYRSLSRSRIDRIEAAGEELPPYTPQEVEADVARLPFAPDAQLWAAVTGQGSDTDLRNRSLAQEAATLFFCTTLDAALRDLIERTGFDLVIVEEAGKCYPSEVLHALALGRCSLLIGDQNQLPPYQEQRTRQHLEAWSAALGRARVDAGFRDDLLGRFGPTAARLLRLAEEATAEGPWLRPFEALFSRLSDRFTLNEQYRMERPLSDLIGSVFYGAPFVHRKTAVSPMAGRLPPALDVPLLWVVTPHCSQLQAAVEDPDLRRSAYELRVVRGYLRRIPGGPPLDMVILTPYNAQKDLLIADRDIDAECRRLCGLPASKVVRTSDEYQGREAELTVISLVRNNTQQRRAWGFMTEPERLNVLFSRARYRQVVIGCAEHVRRHEAEAGYLHRVLRAYEDTTADPQAARFLSAKELLDHGK